MVKSNIKECLKNEDNSTLELDLNSLKLNKFPSELKKEIYRDKKKGTKAMIKRLDVSINKLNDFKWDLSSSFDQLEYLNLSGNPLSSLMMVGLPGSSWIKTVTKIDVCGCKLLRIGQNDLRQFSNLTVLNLSNNEISEIHSDAFSCLPQLEDLNVSGNSSLKVIPDAILNCRHITHLDMSGCSLSGLPNDLSPLTKILELNLGNNDIKELPDSISHLVYLCKLNLQDNSITNLPLTIGKCRGLVNQSHSLILHGNPLDIEIKQLYNENPAKLLSFLERRYQIQGGDTLNFKLAAQQKRQSPPIQQQQPPPSYNNQFTTSPMNTPTTSQLSSSAGGSSMASSSSPRSYKLSESNESWRELPNHIPGPKMGGSGGGSGSGTPISSSPMMSSSPITLQPNIRSTSPSPLSSSPSPYNHINSNGGGIKTQFQFSDSPSSSPSTPSPMMYSSSPRGSQEDPTITMMKENIYTMIKMEFRQKITTIYERVNKSSNVQDLIQYAHMVKSIQSELDEIGKLLTYRKIYLPSSNIDNIGSGSGNSEIDKFNQLKQIVKSKIEICVIYSKNIIEHVDLQHSLSDLSFIYRVIKSLSNKLTL